MRSLLLTVLLLCGCAQTPFSTLGIQPSFTQAPPSTILSPVFTNILIWNPSGNVDRPQLEMIRDVARVYWPATQIDLYPDIQTARGLVVLLDSYSPCRTHPQCSSTTVDGLTWFGPLPHSEVYLREPPLDTEYECLTRPWYFRALIVAHEIGHQLGHPHSTNPTNIMYAHLEYYWCVFAPES